MPFMALNQKIISALTTGDVPDLIFHIAPRHAPAAERVERQDGGRQRHRRGAQGASSATPRCCRPTTTTTSPSGAPTTWCRSARGRSRSTSGAIWSRRPASSCRTPEHLGCPSGISSSRCRQVLRGKGMRRIYAMGPQMTTVGPNDGNGLIAHFMIANGGADIVTPDGKLHTDDPQVREAAIRTVSFLTNCLQAGLRAARGHKLDRCRRQQRVPREAHRDGFRRFDVHRAGDDQGQEGVFEEMRTSACRWRGRQADACAGRRRRPVHPQGRRRTSKSPRTSAGSSCSRRC